MKKINESKNILISLIDPSSRPVRDIDPDQLSDLTNSIREQDVLQSILVRQVGERFEVVFGNHRYYAAKRAGLVEIPCTVRVLTDDEALLLSLSENIHRVDMNPVNEGKAYTVLLKNYPIKELSKRMGKGVPYIQGRVQISENIHPDLVKEIGSGELTVTSALSLSKLPRAKQLEIFDQIKKYKDNPGGGGRFGGGGNIYSGELNYCVCPKCGVKHIRGT